MKMHDHITDGPDDWRPATPLEDMHYLDGYLDYIFNDDDLPDGAWWAMLESTIEDHWPDADGNETLHAYLEWKENASRS